MVGLAHQIATFVGNRQTPLREIYYAFPDKPRTTVRGRIYENLGRLFERLERGVYIATAGNAKCVIVKGDAWEELKNLKDESFDALLTDPPYPWLNRFVEMGTTRKKSNRLSYETKDLDQDILWEMYRILKPRAHAFFFVPAESAESRPHIDAFIARLEKVGFMFNKRFVWSKERMGMGYNGRAYYEGILFMSKGKRRMPCDRSIPDLIKAKPPSPQKRKHEAEKPVELLEPLVKFSTNEGEWAIDPFAGSGNIGKACLNLKRNCVLIEMDEHLVRDVIVPNLEAECLEMAGDGKI